ncbi:MAG TPA: aminotransferase class IV [Candidatus Polarisedimenticolia bacterium]|nr:aminotransferase class IV [Candidatus Polarisedimenticolia bacterium]
MSDRISVNGTLTSPAEAAVSPLDRGFLFGDSVYETIRTYGGRPFRLRQHLERLRRSADELGIALDRAPVDVEQEIGRALAAAANPESAVRVVLSRGVGPIGYDPEPCGPPTVVVYVRPCPLIPEGWHREGVDVAIVRVTRNAVSAVDPAIKSSNLLNNFLAWKEARPLGVFEPILLSPEGRLAEGASSNVFLVRGGSLLTPGLETGILRGITRDLALELARGGGLPVSEEALGPDDLRRAEEAFLTSTLKGILPIRRCDGWPVHDGRPGPVTLRLLELFDAVVRAETAEAQGETKTGSLPGSTLR